MTGKLTKMQKRFLGSYVQSRSISDAAACCGIPPELALEEAVKIFRHPDAAEFVKEASEAVKQFGGGAEECLDRLINGRINDAVMLAKSNPEDITPEELRRLDLYNVSEMKFGKGICEIKFADRVKAAEKLNEIRSGRATENAAQSFFDAIGKAAEDTDKDG